MIFKKETKRNSQIFVDSQGEQSSEMSLSQSVDVSSMKAVSDSDHLTVTLQR